MTATTNSTTPVEYPVLLRTCDVTIVGAGMVGMLLALLLQQQGLSVQVYERQGGVYPLPRAVAIAEDNLRLLDMIGLPYSKADLVAGDVFPWKDVNGNVIACIDNSIKSNALSDMHPTYLFCQPLLESALNLHCEARNIQLFRNWNFCRASARDEEGYRTLEFERPAFAIDVLQQVFFQHNARVRCKWVIGADGANSTVRAAANIGLTDLGFQHEWLVIDTFPPMEKLQEQRAFFAAKKAAATTAAADDNGENNKTSNAASLPSKPPLESAQICNPQRPTTAVSSGPRRHRWEFMRLPGESDETLLHPDTIWGLLRPYGVYSHETEIERAVVYRFQSKLANSFWSDGFGLVGDAAHTMPPFIGQGLNTGLRDTIAMAWRLAQVHKGLNSERLFDSYTIERRSQADAIIRLAIRLGQPICMTNKDEAEAMHGAMHKQYLDSGCKSTQITPPDMVADAAAIFLSQHCGGCLELSAPVRHADGIVNIRRHVEWVVFHARLCTLTDAHKDALVKRNNIRIVPLSAQVDVTGRYHAWIAKCVAGKSSSEDSGQQNISASSEELWCITRPDLYVYAMGAGQMSFDKALAMLERDLLL